MQERDHPSTGWMIYVADHINIRSSEKRSESDSCFACSNTDVHTVASLLKLYLRQLPEPLVPYSCYQDFLLCGQELLTDRSLVSVLPLLTYVQFTYKQK